MGDCFKWISESLDQLAKSKDVLIEKPSGARWAIERWKITLLQPGRVGVSDLKKARANDLLEFMRRKKEEDGGTVFKGIDWLTTVPIPGAFDNMKDFLECITESLIHLQKTKHVRIKVPPGSRWKVEHWEISLQ